MKKIISLGLAGVLVILAAAVYENFTGLHTDEEKFDEMKWKSQRDQSMQIDPGCVRGGMALNIIKNDLLANKTKLEVAGQLGSAEVTSETQLRYPIGQCHWGWKHSSLVVHFNTNTFVKATIEID
jgi:hypothetical protein